MKLRMLLSNTEKLSNFLKIRTDVVPFNHGRWTKRVFDKFCFVSRKAMLSIFRVGYNEHLLRIEMKRYLGFSFSKTL